MANKPLKTIKFPGLDDTYTIPQKTSDIENDSGFQTDEDVSDAISDNIDDTLSTTGKSADAKAVGDKIAEIETESVESYITNTSTGSIASFTDGADDIPVKDLKFNIEPVQDLHGYDHPWPEGGGKNILKVTATTQTINGITFTVNDDGTIVVNGTATADAVLRLFDGTGDFTNCIISGCPSGGTTSTYYAALSNVTITSLVDFGTERVITIENTGRWIYNITIKNGYTANNLVFKPMIRLASVTDPTFAPYSNICPITGWTEIEGVRSGKNLLNNTLTSRTQNGTTFTTNADKSITVSGTPTALTRVPIKTGLVWDGRAAVVLSFGTMPTGTRVFVRRILNGRQDYPTVNPTSAQAVGSAIYDVYLEINTSFAGTAFTLYPQLELGSTATDYEPYHVTQIPITLPQEAGTVYGGYVDVTEGKLVVDRASVDLGSLTYARYTELQDSYVYQGAVPLMDASSAKAICSTYAVRDTWTGVQYLADKTAQTHPSLNRLYIRDDDYTDATVFKSAMQGVQLVYELATPIEYSLTPRQVNSLLGENHIWCDSGETEVEYRADTKLYIDGKIAELQALILENGGN